MSGNWYKEEDGAITVFGLFLWSLAVLSVFSVLALITV